MFIKVIFVKKIIVPIICILLIGITFFYIEPITDKIVSFIDNKPNLVISESNKYTKNKSYLYVQYTDEFIPYSYQDLLNIMYSVIDNGWTNFTFYCPSEYENCVNDIGDISSDEVILTHLNNYVHPFNSFTNIKTSISESGEVNLKINRLYTEDEISAISIKVKEIIQNEVKSTMSDKDKIKAIHDYIINNAKYDTERNTNNDSQYRSYNAYGPLFEGYAICNGYTDLMAIFLSEMGYDNYKIATTPEEISYSDTGHIWNAVYVDNTWLHLDLTWDDPVSSDGKDYLFYNYFLVTNEEMQESDDGNTKIEEHNFNKLFYLEFND
jgi:hypothetical protein